MNDKRKTDRELLNEAIDCLDGSDRNQWEARKLITEVIERSEVFGDRFGLGDRVRKTKGASWQGKVVGFYSTDLTPVGYAVESEREPGSVQIYPEAALERV